MKKILIVLFATGSMMACKNSSNLSKVTEEPQKHLYIDVHHLGAGKVTAEDVAKAHEQDLQVQDEFDVDFMKYWVDEASGTVYCLSESPSEDLVKETHENAHGLVPQEIYEVSSGEEASASGKSRYFLDIHELGEGKVTKEAVAEAHEHDLQVQGKNNVNFINYWVAEKEGVVYCLSEANDEEKVIQTHSEAHGLIPDQIVEVIPGE